MNTKYFLDTNIFVYTFDSTEPEKRAKARDLVSHALRRTQGVTSYQVVQEFINVATRRFERPLMPQDCAAYLDTVLAPLCQVFPSIDMYKEALDIHERWQFSYYDSLIVTAALSAGCERLYSDDLQHGQTIRDLVIENPFRVDA
jgi:predicted nucleic acid-binding protein